MRVRGGKKNVFDPVASRIYNKMMVLKLRDGGSRAFLVASH